MINLMYDVMVVCITASCFFLLITIIKPITQKYFSATWHYNVLKLNILLFIVPVYSIIKKIVKVFSLPTFIHSYSMEFFANEFRHEVVTSDFQNNQLTSMVTSNSKYVVGNIVMVIWILGIVASIIWHFYCGLRLKNEITQTYKITDNNICRIFDDCKKKLEVKRNMELEASEQVYSPMLVDLINPKVVLSSVQFQEKYLEYIFIHELIHYKRKDLWWKTTVMIISIIFWFNPLVYILNICFEKELEVSCDEMVVGKLCVADRKKYGLAILESINSKMKANLRKKNGLIF